MEVKMIIGLPIKKFTEAYTRLNNVISLDERVHLSKALLENIVNCFNQSNNDIYLITRDKEVIEFAKELEVFSYSSSHEGLNSEIKEFFDAKVPTNSPWCIIHSDLPYINKFNARQVEEEIERNDFLASRSEDNGTPIFGGSKSINKFHYGKDSFSKFKKEIQEIGNELYIMFPRELNFEIDTEENYREFIDNLPNWYKELRT